MPSIAWLLKKLKADYPLLKFEAGSNFRWSPSKQTVFYDQSQPQVTELLLHETAHGVLGHKNYTTDVELIAMESAAWQTAFELAKTYGLTLAKSAAEDHLDTYRDWLHARSTCPNCTATGYQTGRRQYSCPACLTSWQVNEARSCALRRYRTASPTAATAATP